MLRTKENIYMPTEITLARYQLWTIDGDRRGDVIICMSGKIWITQEGDLKDYVIEAGQDFWVTRRGSVVVQALENAQFKYSLNELQSHIEHGALLIRRPMLPRASRILR